MPESPPIPTPSGSVLANLSGGQPAPGRDHDLPRQAVALAMILLGALLAATPAQTAAPRQQAGADLTGEWVLNAVASQSLDLRAPPDRLRRAESAAPASMPPEDSVLPDPPSRSDDIGARPSLRRQAPSWLVRPERLEAMRTLLGEARTLAIVQTATYVDLRSDLAARSLEIGADSQVSLPTGELADQRVRWQGRRLVIERRVPRGVKIVETYQLLPATDQLEVMVRRSGGPDDGLGKIELRRIFDRDRGAEPAQPNSGPAPSRPGTARSDGPPVPSPEPPR